MMWPVGEHGRVCLLWEDLAWLLLDPKACSRQTVVLAQQPLGSVWILCTTPWLLVPVHMRMFPSVVPGSQAQSF